MDSDSTPYQILYDPESYTTCNVDVYKTLVHACGFLKCPPCEISVSLIDVKSMRELNKQHRDRDKATDVLSFPQLEWNEPFSGEDLRKWDQCLSASSMVNTTFIERWGLGDIVVAPVVAESNALDIGQSVEREIQFLLVHGFLHLLGHDHQVPEEEQVMVDLQKKILTELMQ